MYECIKLKDNYLEILIPIFFSATAMEATFSRIVRMSSVIIAPKALENADMFCITRRYVFVKPNKGMYRYYQYK